MENSKSYCSTCNRQTNQEVLYEYEDKSHEDMGWWEETYYQVIRCAGCDTITFRKLHNNAQQQSDPDEDGTTEELFPTRGTHSPIIVWPTINYIINGFLQYVELKICAFCNGQICSNKRVG
jgi:hypothetical protein